MDELKNDCCVGPYVNEAKKRVANAEVAKRVHKKAGFSEFRGPILRGPRSVVDARSQEYPRQLLEARNPPEKLYVLGNVEMLSDQGLAIIGARKATPYGLGCVSKFGGIAAGKGIPIVSGGARGCDARAHSTAITCGCPTVVVLGGGCDQLYPPEHFGLFQDVIIQGGAVVSEHPWEAPPLPYTFRERNRIIAGLSRAVLIVEAGYPSGTFSTADEALAASRDVLVVPGAVTSPHSHGSNRLLFQGATPVVDEEVFQDILFSIFGCLKQEAFEEGQAVPEDPLLVAILAAPSSRQELLSVAMDLCGSADPSRWLSQKLAQWEIEGLISRYPNGRYGPVVK